MITFSIVTITYNAAHVLQPTINSILYQDYPHIEHLIIDGKSKDNTIEIAKRYKEISDTSDNGHQIVIKSEPDEGLYYAMNKGIDLATGDYILFLNAGDRLPNQKTLKSVALTAEAGDGEEYPAVIFGETNIIDNTGKILYSRRLKAPEVLTWHSFINGMVVCHQAFYVRLDIAKKIHYNTKYRFSSDVDWCINIMKEAEKRGLLLRNVHSVIAHYLATGTTTNNHFSSLIERFKIMSHHFGIIKTILKHISFIFRNIHKY